MATKLSLYNGALLECGERKLASLAELAESRTLLDLAWDNGAVDFALRQGQWKFATRTVELVPDTNITPSFGYQFAYQIPSDHVKTLGISADEYLNYPLTQYSIETGYIFADVSPLYFSYVSNGASYGGDYTNWPEDFVEYFHAYLASKIIKKLNQSNEDLKTMHTLVKRRLTNAKSSDGMEGPTKFMPSGAWVQARRGGYNQGRKNRSSLLG